MEIFIANLNTDIEEESLTKLFEAFGPVTSAVLIRDKETRASKGYGFIVMDDAIDAQRAIDDLNGREVAGKLLTVKKSVPKEAQTSTNNGKGNSQANQSDKKYENREPGQVEDIPINVIDEVSFVKTDLEDGLVSIKFNN